MTTLTPTPKQQFLDANGNPLSGGKVYSYAAGTTSPLVTYTDESGTTPNTNPVILDSRGEAEIWLGVASYKLKLTTSTDVEIWTVDNIVSASVQALADLSESNGSALVGYLPAGTGAVATTVQAKLRQTVSVKDFGAVGDGITNDTVAIQAAVDYARSSNNETVVFSAGRYLITNTINIGPGTKIQGSNTDYGGVAGTTSFPLQLSDSKGTVIIFAPTTEKSLFVPSLPLGGSAAWSAISIKGLNIWGNTTPDAFHRAELGIAADITTSLYAIDFDNVQYGNVENVAIMGFQAGIREGHGCQENTFTKVNIQRCRVSVLYSSMTSAAEATSSVWRDCVMRTSLHAVQCIDDGSQTYSGDSLQIRFHSCYFEDVASHGFVLARRSKDWCFVDCYGEQIGKDTGVATRSCFYVGAGAGIGAATTLNSLSILGGQYAGDDSAASIFLQANYTDGVNLIGCTAKRFGVGISATANTRDKSIYMANPLFNSVPTLFSGTTNKLQGIYRTVTTEGGSNEVILKISSITADGDLVVFPAVGSNLRLGDGGTTGDVRPGNAAVDLGDSAIRWRYIYSDGLTTDANYLLYGKTAYVSTSTDGVALNKLGFIQASYTSSPAVYLNRNGTDGTLVSCIKAGVNVGSISVTASATAYNTSSDYRLKENVNDLQGSGTFIDALRPRSWEWKATGATGAGFIAHELQSVSPSSVTGTKDAVDADGNPEFQAVEYGSAEVIANLIAEVQALRIRLAGLESKFKE